jgi:hypothetical protein
VSRAGGCSGSHIVALGPRQLGRITHRCFFVFEDGPPNTHHELNGYGDDLLHRYLDAVLVNGRIGLIYGSKDYSSEWNFHAKTKQFMQQDPTKFGVNPIVYALTR